MNSVLSKCVLFRERPTVVMVTGMYWNGLQYQDHRFAERFVAGGARFVFIERSPQRWPRWGIADLSQWIRGVGPGVEKARRFIPSGMTVLTPRWLPPAQWLRPINREIIRRDIRKVSNTTTVIISFVPTYNTIDLIELVQPEATAYVCSHNYDADRVMPDLLLAERELIEKCDALFADSEFLKQRLAILSRGRKINLSLHGVDYQAFRSSYRGDEVVRRKTIYYFGGIGPHIDLKLYGEMASAGFRVVLIGPVALSARGLIPPNVEIGPPIDNSALPGKLKNADILLLAYIDSPYMRGVFPAKFFECLATGKPLLVSGLPEIAFYKDIVYDVGNSKETALSIIDNLVSTETPERLQRRDSIAREADWSGRFEEFVQNLDNAYRNKQKHA